MNEEGIYRKNGVSHRITQFIERNFINISNLNQQSSNMTNSNNVSITINNDHTNHTNGITNDHNSSSSQNSSFISNVLKSANIPIISHSSSFSTLSFLVNHQSNSNSNKETNGHNHNENNSTGSSSPSAQTQLARNNSSSNLSTDIEDTCTITSALKHYLIHLKEPLMTFSFNQQFLIACRKENITEKIVEIHKLLHQLPPLNFEALELLMNHLHK